MSAVCFFFFPPLALLRWSSSLLKYPVVYGRFSPFLNYFPQYFLPLLPQVCLFYMQLVEIILATHEVTLLPERTSQQEEASCLSPS